MYCEYIISRNNAIAITISNSVKIKFLVPTSTEATMKSLVFCVKEAICRFGQASTRHDCTGSRKYRQLIKMNNFCYYRLPIFFRWSLISRIVRSTWCLVSFLQPWIIRSFATTGFLYSFVDHWSVVSWYQIFWIVRSTWCLVSSLHAATLFVDMSAGRRHHLGSNSPEWSATVQVPVGSG